MRCLEPATACAVLNWQPHALSQEGCDFFADIHGDEEIEYNFLAGNEGIPAWDDRLKRLQDEFCAAFLHTSPDFQNGWGLASPACCSAVACMHAHSGFGCQRQVEQQDYDCRGIAGCCRFDISGRASSIRDTCACYEECHTPFQVILPQWNHSDICRQGTHMFK